MHSSVLRKSIELTRQTFHYFLIVQLPRANKLSTAGGEAHSCFFLSTYYCMKVWGSHVEKRVCFTIFLKLPSDLFPIGLFLSMSLQDYYTS